MNSSMKPHHSVNTVAVTARVPIDYDADDDAADPYTRNLAVTSPRKSLKDVASSISKITNVITTIAAEVAHPIPTLKDRHKATSARERKRLIEERYLARISEPCHDLNQHQDEQEVVRVIITPDVSVSEMSKDRAIVVENSTDDTWIENSSRRSSLQRARVNNPAPSDTSISSGYTRKKNRIPVSILMDLPSSTGTVDEAVSGLKITMKDKQLPAINLHRPVVVTDNFLPQSPHRSSLSSASKKKTKKKNKKQRKQQRMYQQMQQQVILQQQQQMYQQTPQHGVVYNDGRDLPSSPFYNHHQYSLPMYPPNLPMYHPSQQEPFMTYQHHDPTRNSDMWLSPPLYPPMEQQGYMTDASRTSLSNYGASNVASFGGGSSVNNNFMPYTPQSLQPSQQDLNYDPRRGQIMLGDSSSIQEISQLTIDSSHKCPLYVQPRRQSQPQVYHHLPHITYQNQQSLHNDSVSNNDLSQGKPSLEKITKNKCSTPNSVCSTSTNPNAATSSNPSPCIDHAVSETLEEMDAAIFKAQSDRSLILESLTHQANVIRVMEEERIAMEQSLQEQHNKATLALQEQERVVEKLQRQKHVVSSLMNGETGASSRSLPAIGGTGDV
mmetsp:Transcript_12134/g.14802  ORF Transcript_12134/g.14802 Transcript_12134/m.14802 type:complete len:609 (-) Transcript_12134:73-1899(-)